jgi:hypothetical protein
MLVLGIIGGIAWYRHFKRKQRTEFLLDKYGDMEVVQRILRGHMWQGQTSEQLLDSVGSPLNIDRKVMASRRREVWKYNSRGRNRYGLRITLDNDIVIGWDRKNGRAPRGDDKHH